MPKNMPKRQSQKLATSGSPEKTSIPSTPQKSLSSPAKPHKFDIIVYEYVELQSKEEFETVAKEIMGRAMESAGYRTVGERTTYGNQEGQNLLEDRHNMKDTLKRMEDWMADQGAQIADDRAQIKRLEDRMANKDTQIADDRAQIKRLEVRMANKDTQIADDRAEIKKLEVRMAKKDAQIASHQARFADFRGQITSLQNRVDSLTTDAEGYYDIRHRFIDFYRRDVRRDATKEVFARIGKGNEKAHEGDAITDAKLYTTGRRSDVFALIDLYGLNPNQISLLSGAHDYSSIINTLNTGATWRKKGPANIPADVADAFQAFITELTANHNQRLTDDTTALNRAYRAFWTAHDNH